MNIAGKIATGLAGLALIGGIAAPCLAQAEDAQSILPLQDSPNGIICITDRFSNRYESCPFKDGSGYLRNDDSDRPYDGRGWSKGICENTWGKRFGGTQNKSWPGRNQSCPRFEDCPYQDGRGRTNQDQGNLRRKNAQQGSLQQDNQYGRNQDAQQFGRGTGTGKQYRAR